MIEIDSCPNEIGADNPTEVKSGTENCFAQPK